jgi:RimJ/RimL family protein N-acetyltransferase
MLWSMPIVTPTDPLTDGVALLRLAHEDDVEAVYTYGQDPDVAETGWLPLPVPCTRAGAARVVQEFQRGWQGRFGLTFVITLPPAADLCGVVHLAIHGPAVVELAYGVAPRHRRRGLATRAVRLVATWAATQGALTRLEICVTARGAHGRASQRVAEQAGFVYAGLRHSHVPGTGSAYDDPLYIRAIPARTDRPHPTVWR